MIIIMMIIENKDNDNNSNNDENNNNNDKNNNNKDDNNNDIDNNKLPVDSPYKGTIMLSLDDATFVKSKNNSRVFGDLRRHVP